ncbi:formate--tetrahydrofolate ligase [Rhodoferax sp.]|uniref:formate--tetrahydrofolate ligase n=1 Tax=Rhodoferax sp. TaxID=50421 RepID=UPI00274B2BCE|nr:formate--tetrahydrofolate ligase [Rhodoferax sp.]
MTRTDIEIAQSASMWPIIDLARERLGIPAEALEPYGHFKAKIDLKWLDTLADRPDGKLVLVTAISPTPAGEGKTTTTVGLGDALNRIGKRTVMALREPSLGPVFGMKGGAAGGGLAQVVPMEDINLHFTGDFHAIALAHNLLAALIDNHIHHGNALAIDPRRIVWRRVMDMNDRAMRSTVVGLGGPGNGFPREDGFDIVAASEVMAIFCLAASRKDLKARLGNIIVGYTRGMQAVRASDLQAHGAMATLLKDAIKPNLVQTLENNLALVHGGPFANIAHGCNTVMATRAALKLGEYVVTEAGFGADLGAEKFIDIKCRKSGLRPDVAVVVATLRALRHHGGAEPLQFDVANAQAVERGIVNLERHVDNVRNHYGLPCVVAVNAYESDTEDELQVVRRNMARRGVPVVVARHWACGSGGAEDLAHAVVQLVEAGTADMRYVYADEQTLWDKIRTVAQQIYGASDISANSSVRAKIAQLQAGGYGHYPVCVAKTQYSFSTDPELRGAPSGHMVNIREVRLAAGAEFVVMICGDVMTMPGLPKEPASMRMDIDDDGRITGLC